MKQSLSVLNITVNQFCNDFLIWTKIYFALTYFKSN